MIRRATRKVLGNAAAVVDRAVTRTAFVRTSRNSDGSRAEMLSHEERVGALSRLALLYETPSAEHYFRPPRVVSPSSRFVRSMPDGGSVVDLAWPSDYTPFLPDMAERYDRAENRVAAVRLFRAAHPRPVAICVHGYLGGHYGMEERAFPVSWFYKIGLDVALFVLPFHGVRGDPRKSAPPFPGADPRMTNEGFRQAMGDLSDFVAWLRSQGHPEVGLLGMSLGGYTTALAATLIENLAFGIPIIPLGSFADIARDQGRIGSSPEQVAVQHAGLERIHRVISPLDRKPLLAPNRMLVIGAKADQITPIAHARRLAAHFGAPLDSWHGGHLLQFGRSEGFRRIGRLLGELGVISR